jgi:hypothetical protein
MGPRSPRARRTGGAGAVPGGGVLSLAQPRPTTPSRSPQARAARVAVAPWGARPPTPAPRTRLLAPAVSSSVVSLHQPATEKEGPHSAYVREAVAGAGGSGRPEEARATRWRPGGDIDRGGPERIPGGGAEPGSCGAVAAEAGVLTLTPAVRVFACAAPVDMRIASSRACERVTNYSNAKLPLI